MPPGNQSKGTIYPANCQIQVFQATIKQIWRSLLPQSNRPRPLCFAPHYENACTAHDWDRSEVRRSANPKHFRANPHTAFLRPMLQAAGAAVGDPVSHVSTGLNLGRKNGRLPVPKARNRAGASIDEKSGGHRQTKTMDGERARDRINRSFGLLRRRKRNCANRWNGIAPRRAIWPAGSRV